MRQTQAKLNWYKIMWKWHRNISIGDFVTATSVLTQEMTKPWSETAVIQAHMAIVPKPCVLFCHHKQQQFQQIMSKGYSNGLHWKKKTIVRTEKNSWMFGEFGFRRSSLRSLTW